MKFLLLSTMMALLASCGSSKKLEEREHENIKRDYEVREASSNRRPGWIEDPEVWADNNDKDMDKYRYFSFETEPKVSRTIACNLAKANVKSDIAGEITTFIDKQLGSSQEGNASIDENNPQVQALRSFVENTLAEKVQAMIYGASVVKTYWEKRQYMAKLGAKKDFKAYTCAVMIRMNSKRLEKAITDAAEFVAQKADDPATKENVKKALNNAADNFAKARRGEI